MCGCRKSPSGSKSNTKTGYVVPAVSGTSFSSPTSSTSITSNNTDAHIIGVPVVLRHLIPQQYRVAGGKAIKLPASIPVLLANALASELVRISGGTVVYT